MQGLPSQNPPAAASDLRSPARDPRIRNRTSTAHAADQNADAGRGFLPENRESLRKGNDTPSTSTPQSPRARLDVPPLSVLSEQPERELVDLFSRHIHDSQSVDFLGRKLAYVRNERNAARLEYKKVKKTRDKFPVVVDQARERLSKTEAVCNTIKQDEANARAAEESSGRKWIKVLLQTVKELVEERDVLVKEKDAQYKLLTEQMGTIQQELQNVLSQQAKAAVQPPPVFNETKIRLENLEEFRAQQESENKTLNSIFNDFHGLKREVNELSSDIPKANESARQHLEELRSEQRANSKADIDALKSVLETLRRRVETLEQKLPPIEARLVDSHNRRALEKDLEEQVQEIKEASKTRQQVADDIERFRKTMHVKVENMHDELRDDISSIRRDLGTLSSQISGQEEKGSELTGRVVGLEDFATTGRRGIESLQTEVDTLKRADQDQSEKVAALDTSMEEFAETLKSLDTQLTHFKATPQSSSVEGELAALRSQFAEHSMERKSFEDKLSEELKALQQQANDARTRQSANNTGMDKDPQALRSQISDLATKEMLNKEVETLTAKLAEQAAVQTGDVKKLQSEFTDYTENWKRSEAERDRALVGEVDKLRVDQAVLKTALAQRPAQGLSPEERQQVQYAAGVAAAFRELAAQVTSLQKDLEKQTHLSVNLNQRFNNLTTDELARRMTGVIGKALPKYEKHVQTLDGVVQKLESEVLRLCQKVDAPDKWEGTALELEKRCQQLKEWVEGVAANMQSSHDNLAKNFEDGRDKIESRVDELQARQDKLQARQGELETSACQDETSQSTYRESTAKNLKGLETRLEGVESRVENITPRELFPNSDHKKQLGVNPPPRSNGGNGSGPRRITVDDSEDEEDSVDAADILARFTKLPPQPPKSSLPRQSSRKSTHSRGSSKRKRSRSQEDATETEYSVKGRASKQPHR
jgi:DNA repair exonuclease SbcCD ATPase subunit